MFPFRPVLRRQVRATILQYATARYHRHCHTLDPHLFRTSDIIDLSGLTIPRVEVEGDLVALHYFNSGKNRLAFPHNARGFLYYHREPGTPPSSGEIRFRVTPDDDVMDFDNGTDLTSSNYMTWSISLFQVSNLGMLPFRSLLIREGWADNALIDSMAGKVFRGQKRPLHYLEQPFVIDLQCHDIILRVFDGVTVAKVRLQLPFRDNRMMVEANPYSGHVLLRLERSTLPQHANSRVIVVRVLKILEEPKVVIPDYDMRLPLPEEGKLFPSISRDRRSKVPYTINLENPSGWNNLNLLLKYVFQIELKQIHEYQISTAVLLPSHPLAFG
ncbi:hypothetical protein C0992_008872 [Termitomyces sp. T32_za158]|nr:hypothetical protein C0992_008872 [Termitomyces sp. T32_za158]